MAALLWGGPRAVVSHRAAGALWKLDGIEPGVVELLTTGTERDVPPGVILHRTRALARSDFGLLDSFRVTGLVRTVLDLAAVIPDPATVEAAAESAARLDESLWPKLAARIGGAGLRGHPGVAAIRAIVRARDPAAAPTESIFETRLFQLIRGAGLPVPVRQLVVPVEGSKAPRVDFAYLEHRVVIEADGYWCHSGRKSWKEGLWRGNTLVLDGWRPLHVTWDDLTNRPDQVIADIRRALAGS